MASMKQTKIANCWRFVDILLPLQEIETDTYGTNDLLLAEL